MLGCKGRDDAKAIFFTYYGSFLNYMNAFAS